jgi:hypothetical protein
MSHFSKRNSNDSPAMKLERWQKRKVRTCRYMNECTICNGKITDGQRYHDGGYGCRAHVGCVEALAEIAKPPVFTHCNVCGIRLHDVDHEETGMCERCAVEEVNS